MCIAGEYIHRIIYRSSHRKEATTDTDDTFSHVWLEDTGHVRDWTRHISCFQLMVCICMSTKRCVTGELVIPNFRTLLLSVSWWPLCITTSVLTKMGTPFSTFTKCSQTFPLKRHNRQRPRAGSRAGWDISFEAVAQDEIWCFWRSDGGSTLRGVGWGLSNSRTD